MRTLCFAIVTVMAALLSQGEQLQLNPVFADHLVLAANKPVLIFGTGSGKVEAEFRGKNAALDAQGGEWVLALPPVDAGGPYTLNITLDGQKRQINDVMVGEVILIAGQSNMQFRLGSSNTPKEEYVDAPMIREFSLPRIEEGEPYSPKDGWIRCSKENAYKWSAIGYLVAQERARVKKCAVGIINCYQGASVIQSWMPKALADDPRFALPPGGKLHFDFTYEPYMLWNKSGVLYNKTFRAITPLQFTQVVWYQGESNTGKLEGAVYDKLLAAMITQWRTDLRDPELPFTVVQIADFNPRNDEYWRAVQEAQMRVPNICPNVKCVKCSDICEKDDIHPKSKKALAIRISETFK